MWRLLQPLTTVLIKRGRMFLSTGARVAHVAWRLRTWACVSHPEAQILKENTRYNCKPISISHQLRRVLSQHGRWVKAARGESDGGCTFGCRLGQAARNSPMKCSPHNHVLRPSMDWAPVNCHSNLRDAHVVPPGGRNHA